MLPDIAPSTFAFATERLRMRPLQAQDEAMFCDLYTDTETMRFIGPPLAAEYVARSFRKLLASVDESPPERVFLAILEKTSQRPIGTCAIVQFDADMARAEVGIMLKSDARARGYAREALDGLVKMAFSAFPVNGIWVECSALNPVVERMVGSIGFTLYDSIALDAGPLSKRIWSVYRPS